MSNHTHPQGSNVIGPELLLICRAQIELRHFGGSAGMKLIDEIIKMDKSDRTEAIGHLISELRTNQIDLNEKESEE